MDYCYGKVYGNDISYLVDVKREDRVLLSNFDGCFELTSFEVAKELDAMSNDDLVVFKEHIEGLKEKYNNIPDLEKSITRVRTMFNYLK